MCVPLFVTGVFWVRRGVRAVLLVLRSGELLRGGARDRDLRDVEEEQ